MNPKAMTSRFVTVATLSLLGALSAAASPILVSNFSFETLPVGGLPSGCGAGCSFSTGAIPGWSGASASSGQFRPGTPGNTTYFNTLTDGITVGFSNGPTISQTVAVTVIPGTTYTLLVDLGRRNDLPFRAGADLRIGGTSVFPALGVSPTLGNWSTFTATYVGLAGDAGKTITIELTSPGGLQGDFDNVIMSSVAAATGVPEPTSGTLTLLALGFAGLLLFARRSSSLGASPRS